MKNKIRETMQWARVDAKLLGELTGMAQPNLYRIIDRDRVEISQYNTLRLIADALGVSVEDLVGEEELIYNNLEDVIQSLGLTVDDVERNTLVDVASLLDQRDLRNADEEALKRIARYMGLKSYKQLYLPAKNLGSK